MHLRTNIFLLCSGAILNLPAVSAFAPLRHYASYCRRDHHAFQLSAIREATFGMGCAQVDNCTDLNFESRDGFEPMNRCFWEPAESLLKQPGVIATTVGYIGNANAASKPPPSYDTVCFGNDYAEAVRVAYDDDVISYDKLLDYFFEFQKPVVGSRQYGSVIFVPKSDEEGQGRIAKKWKEYNMQKDGARTKDNLPYSIVDIEPMETSFFKAEEYHQRYWEKQRLRALVGIILLAGASGAYDAVAPFSSLQSIFGNVGLDLPSLESICNVAFLVGAGWMLLERLVDRSVSVLNDGDFVNLVAERR